MKILMLGLNYAPEKIGIAVYTTGMAEALAGAGHEVRVIAGQPYYPAWSVTSGYGGLRFASRMERGVAVTRVPHYVPAQQSGWQRVVHYASFGVAALGPTLWSALSWRPDVVLTVAPSLIAAPVARLAALMCGARSWLHVQDFETEAAFATGLLAGRGLIAGLARRFESAVMKSFHRLSSISPEMCCRLTDMGIAQHRVIEFRNWADVDHVRPLTGPSSYRERWGIATPHVALYAGNIAEKQGIEIVAEAAQRLSHRRDLTFVVCGEGPNRRRLERLVGGLGNVQFRDLQSCDRLSELMGLATVHLLPQLAGAADLVMPSKLTNMLASGRPVVATAASGSGLAREVEDCGVVVQPGDGEAFAAAITDLIDDVDRWRVAAIAARARAEERWAKRLVLGRFIAELERLQDEHLPSGLTETRIK